MELKDFIRESLVDIHSGIREANEKYKEFTDDKENAFHLWPSVGEKAGEKGVHFDVAVTTKKEAGAKASISVFSVGAGVKAQAANESVSRIQFTVAVHHFLG